MATLIDPWLGVNMASGSAVTNQQIIFTSLVQNNGRTATKQGVVTGATSGNVATDTLTVKQISRPAYISASSQQVGASARSITMQGTSNCKGLNFAKASQHDDHFVLPRNYQVLVNGSWIDVGIATAITGDPGASAEYQWRITLTMDPNTLATSITEYLQINDIENIATPQSPGMTQLGTSASIRFTDDKGDDIDYVEVPAEQGGTNAVNVYLTANDAWSLTGQDSNSQEPVQEEQNS
jgi:hypothetical protein